MIKKRTTLLLALLLAGCAQSQPEPEKTEPVAEKTADEKTADEKTDSLKGDKKNTPAISEELDMNLDLSSPEENPKENTSRPAEQSEDNGTGTVVNGILIVNKKNPISPTYNPGENPEAVNAVLNLIQDAQSQGMDIISNWSGFRDYATQQQLYEGYVASDGVEAADTYSARPGYSEHQTGLTFDLKHSDGQLVTREAEANWLKNNAAKYGFIIRYPNGKEAITGYEPEPWHLRYVGKKDAEAIAAEDLTLEEYLGVEGGDYAD